MPENEEGYFIINAVRTSGACFLMLFQILLLLLKSCQKLGFDPGSVHVRFVMDKVALGQVFPRALRFSPVSFIPTVLHYKEKRKN